MASIKPNNKIPAIVDPEGDNGKPFALFESGAILMYLAEKFGKFLPKETTKRYETIQWVFWQTSGLGPMAGQFNHFDIYAKEKIPYAIERYQKETERLFKVLSKQLEGKNFIIEDELTIADMAVWPWVNTMLNRNVEGLKPDQWPILREYCSRLSERDGFKVGSLVNKQ